MATDAEDGSPAPPCWIREFAKNSTLSGVRSLEATGSFGRFLRTSALAAGRVRRSHTRPAAKPVLVANVGGTPKEMLVTPGPNSAVHVPAPFDGGSRNPVTLGFVKRKPKDGTAGHEGLALWHDDGRGT